MTESLGNMSNLPGPNILIKCFSLSHSLCLTYTHTHPQASVKECLLVLLESVFPHLLVIAPFRGLSFGEWSCHSSALELH